CFPRPAAASPRSCAWSEPQPPGWPDEELGGLPDGFSDALPAGLIPTPLHPRLSDPVEGESLDLIEDQPDEMLLLRRTRGLSHAGIHGLALDRVLVSLHLLRDRVQRRFLVLF